GARWRRGRDHRAGDRDRDRRDRGLGGWICRSEGPERRALAATRPIPENAGPQLRRRCTAPLPPAWTGRRLAREDCVCLSVGCNGFIIPLRLRSSVKLENFMEFEDAR